MATIYPFRALRYRKDLVALSDVVTQPYDKITPAMQDRYYSLSPYNLVRIILGKTQPGDNAENVYTRAAANLRDWRASGVLARDEEPSIYAYSQVFTVPGDSSGNVSERRGFIALGRIEDYGAGIVHRHEQTLSAPKADRLNLLRATRAHFGQIFMLYSEPQRQIEQLLFPQIPLADPAASTTQTISAPDAEVTDEYGVIHRLWCVSDASVITKVQEAMLNKKLIIADGHHRYETAMNYRNERRAAAGALIADAPYERVMMTFVNMDSEGLVILPTHRVVFGLDTFNAVRFVEHARRYFSVDPLRDPVTGERATQLLKSKGADVIAFIASTAQGDFLLERNDEPAPALAPLSPDQRNLNVVQLHKLLLEDVLGISEEAIRNQIHVRYVRDAGEAIDQTRRGQADVSFLMNPVRMQQVRDIAFAGEVLPQKSTDFYPKLLSGLTAYSLE
jgi:uncharacterized protein (DUF1015 family)